MVAEVADHSAAFVSAPAEGTWPDRDPRMQDQQRWMSFGGRVDLEGDVIARIQIGERGGEQSSGGLD